MEKLPKLVKKCQNLLLFLFFFSFFFFPFFLLMFESKLKHQKQEKEKREEEKKEILALFDQFWSFFHFLPLDIRISADIFFISGYQNHIRISVDTDIRRPALIFGHALKKLSLSNFAFSHCIMTTGFHFVCEFCCRLLMLANSKLY